MKFRSFTLCLALSVAAFTGAQAQTPSATPPPAATASASEPAADPARAELQALVIKIKGKLQAGQNTAEALAPELKEFEALQARHPEKNDTTASIGLMRAMLYVQVLNDLPKARELLAVVKKDYPETQPGKSVDQILAQLDRMEKDSQTKAALVGKTAPELHFKWASDDTLKTLSGLKGKVVVLDFWATWCGPCIASFPQVREHVAHFKDSPVKFIGVTSIQGRVSNLARGAVNTQGDPAKELSLLPEFMKEKEMTWDVAVSEEEVFNPDYGIQGIPFLAIIAPDGTVRHAGLHPGDPAANISGKIEAILKEFNLPTPKAD